MNRGIVDERAIRNGKGGEEADKHMVMLQPTATPSMVVGNRYQLIQELGGNMGRVFQAIDTVTGRTVAIKVLRVWTDGDPESALRSYREGAVLSALTHPNVVDVYSAVVEDNQYFLIMEFLEGRSLAQILRSERLTFARIQRIALQVARALAYAHGRAIVHRDIKPDNIMVVGDDHVKVTDFGIARILRSGSTLNTATGMTMGTPLYMAPEQIEGQKVDGRADIYSFGAVLYQMVTGHPPFEGDDPITIAFKHVHKEPRKPKELAADVPDGWEAVILKCLAKDPGERYQSAKVLEAAIEALPVLEGVSRNPVGDSHVPEVPTSPPALEAPVWSGNTTVAFNAESVSPTGDARGSPLAETAMEGSNRRVSLRAILVTLRERWAVSLLVLALTATLLLWSISRAQMHSTLNGLQATATAQKAQDEHTLATAVAGPSATETAAAQATATAAVFKTEIARQGGFVFGPTGGQLSGNNQTVWAGQDLRDFIADVTFYNPPGMRAAWDYGLMFRNTQRGGQYRLILESNGRYALMLHDMSRMMVARVVASGRVRGFHTSPGSSNTVQLDVSRGTATFTVNDSFVKSLDVSDKQDNGDIGVGTALNEHDHYRGMPIGFTGFTVRHYSINSAESASTSMQPKSRLK